jgi:cell division protease FtsH
MSETLGPLTFGKREEQIFLGREIAKSQDYSEETAVQIDQQVRQIVSENYDRSLALLTSHKVTLLKIADELLAREVLDADQVKRLSQGLPIEDAISPAAAPVNTEDAPRRETPTRPTIVPALGKTVTQE